jgi:hypothetical protein
LKIPKIYEVIPIELFVDMKNLVKVACRTMLESFVLLNIYLKINLKGESRLGAIEYIVFS